MNGKEIVPVDYIDASVVVEPVESDSVLIDMWLQGLPASTQRAYRREVHDLLKHVNKPLRNVTLVDMQAYERAKLLEKADTSRARAIAAIRSLYKRLQESGYITVNPASFWRAPKLKETLAERYLTPDEIDRILAHAKTERDHALINLMYWAGLRVSEAVALTWKDVLPTPSGATLVIFGKGGKTRYVGIEMFVYDELVALRTGNDAGCIFRSGKTGGCLTERQAYNIVAKAAEQAGIEASPHYLRHAHASHALENDTPVALVRDTLGHASIATTNKYAHSKPRQSSSSYLRKKYQ